MDLETKLRAVFAEFCRRKTDRKVSHLRIEAPDCWHLAISFELAGQGEFRMRNLREGDAPCLVAFGKQLSEASRDLFCPYPWGDPNRLEPALTQAISNATNRIDASYLLEHDCNPIGQFFLWKAGANPHSLQHDLEVSELGIAVADAYQGRGLGGLMLRVLLALAHHLGADAVELTTALSNEMGRKLYLNAGFKCTGVIYHPLEVDVTAATAGDIQATKYRDEWQMVCVVNKQETEAIENYLALKRAAADKMRVGRSGD